MKKRLKSLIEAPKRFVSERLIRRKTIVGRVVSIEEQPKPDGLKLALAHSRCQCGTRLISLTNPCPAHGPWGDI